MPSTVRPKFSILGALKERLSARLGEVLYRIFIETCNPFGAAEVVEEEEAKAEIEPFLV